MWLAAQAGGCLNNFEFVKRGQEEQAVQVYEDVVRD